MSGTSGSPRVNPEDLVDVIIAADNLRRESLRQPLCQYRPSQRIWIEPFFNLLGMLFGGWMRLLPWPWRRSADLNITLQMSKHPPVAEEQTRMRMTQVTDLAMALRRETGQWPATLILTSHPPTVGPWEWLRFEVVRHGLLLGYELTRAAHPAVMGRPTSKCFLAIDPYALDTVAPATGGFYAAWMHQIYLAYDRQVSTQSWIQRHLFLRHTGYPYIAWRLLRNLKQNVPVVMVLGGGLPQNARLLYACREFIQRMKLSLWHSPKRAVEKRWMELLMQPAGDVWMAETGALTTERENMMRSFLLELGMSTEQIPILLDDFKAEFARAVPYRARLIPVLAHRWRRGKPLLLVPIAHAETEPLVRAGPPWALWWNAHQGWQQAVGSLQTTQSTASLSAFGRAFVEQNF